jgi:hypothetical protein
VAAADSSTVPVKQAINPKRNITNPSPFPRPFYRIRRRFG